MGEFKGFDPNIFTLLEINKFNDSKSFYDSVKEEIKQKAIVPMRKLASDLSDEFFKLDEQMVLIPSKMVSRIRRDTRFSKNKELYRANVWCMFMRDKHTWDCIPCMWFEYYPDFYSYGIGTFRADSKFLECYRNYLSEHQKEFKEALRLLSLTGATAEIECFKKDKPGIENIDDELKKYYNCKSMHFIYSSNNMKKLIDGSIKEELIYAYRAFAPMYKFLINVTDIVISKETYHE